MNSPKENKQPKVALCMIVAPTDRESELLDRCLSGKVTEFKSKAQSKIDLKGVGSIADAVDGIFITITGRNDKCEAIAKKYGAVISFVEWENDFAKARNFNFSQVPEEFEYIIWGDTDDVWYRPELIRTVVKKAKEKFSDGVILKYYYDFDMDGDCSVEHLKTRIVKNDGTILWAGEVHEDFAPKRSISVFLNEEVILIHLTDPKRIEDSKLRNKYIAEEAVRKNPKDPRTYWNLANTYNILQRQDEAIKIYLQFLEISQSDEERFLSWYRLSLCYFSDKNLDHAIEAGLEALSLRPWYPDPYTLLGEIYYESGKYRNAQEFTEIGLTKEPPEKDSIVWNPLDYSYNPHLLLGKIYIALEKPRKAIEHFEKCLLIKPNHKGLKDIIKNVKPEVRKFDMADEIYKKAKKAKNKEEIKELLDSVPEDMKYYPPIVSLRNLHFIKKESSGKDLVIYCGYTSIEWNPEVADKKGVGGSEEAVIQLAKRFKKLGYNVTVYANTPKSQEYEFDGITWKPFMSWNYRDKQDIVIIWRHPRFLDYGINADKIYVDVHDVIPPEEFTKSRLLTLTKVLFKSNVQRKYYPNIPDDKVAVIPHGLDQTEFDELRDDVEKDPYLILNTSSPDRSLLTSMEIMKRTHERLPEDLKKKVRFSQYYGFDVWDSEFENDEQMKIWKNNALKKMDELKALGIMTMDSGVKISQREITKKYLKAGLLLYPSTFFEIGFISGIKAMLGGCIPLTTDVFAQGEFCKGIIVHSDVNYKNWGKDVRQGGDYGVENIDESVDKLVDYLHNIEKYDILREQVIDHAKTFDWDITAKMWVKEFENGK